MPSPTSLLNHLSSQRVFGWLIGFQPAAGHNVPVAGVLDHQHLVAVSHYRPRGCHVSTRRRSIGQITRQAHGAGSPGNHFLREGSQRTQDRGKIVVHVPFSHPFSARSAPPTRPHHINWCRLRSPRRPSGASPWSSPPAPSDCPIDPQPPCIARSGYRKAVR